MPEWQALETSGPLGPPGRCQEAVWDLSRVWGDGPPQSRSWSICHTLMWACLGSSERQNEVQLVPGACPLSHRGRGAWPIRATLPLCHLCCGSHLSDRPPRPLGLRIPVPATGWSPIVTAVPLAGGIWVFSRSDWSVHQVPALPIPTCVTFGQAPNPSELASSPLKCGR